MLLSLALVADAVEAVVWTEPSSRVVVMMVVMTSGNVEELELVVSEEVVVEEVVVSEEVVVGIVVV